MWNFSGEKSETKILMLKWNIQMGSCGVKWGKMLADWFWNGSDESRTLLWFISYEPWFMVTYSVMDHFFSFGIAYITGGLVFIGIIVTCFTILQDRFTITNLHFEPVSWSLRLKTRESLYQISTDGPPIHPSVEAWIIWWTGEGMLL